MPYANIEDERAYDREWKRRHRREHSEEVRAADRSRHARRTPTQKSERLEKAGVWRRKNPEKARNRSLKHRYGITLERYNELFVAQGGLCAICKKPPGTRVFSVDHDHVTGEVRGLLHQKCNTILGLAQDSVEHLEAAIAYLRSKRS